MYYGSFDRLNGGDSGRFASGFAFGFGRGSVLLAFHDAFRHHTFQEEGDSALVLGGFAYFGAWGEDT